ncbi:MAG: pilus assembly PilX N-terminal domain-containing protein [Gammaproteobacteria bacterium]|nr:pilus assembly PilX N-terminal domain-containing protein [Gammaproteobacteria bacterium]MDE2250215.1 pilus assembly PilX N-terminal domain-containing protein [Gammaproteobacteria bacterium]
MRNSSPPMIVQRQRGAALVVGLLLLLVLTLLAVSGMNSASLEFIMAGNEQYRSNAFQAAEAGIEQTISLGAFNPGSPAQTLNGAPTATDSWTATVTPQLLGVPLPAIWGNSWNSFSTYHFEIASIGTSSRSATANNLQGVAVISPWDPTVQPDPNAATTALQ